MKKLLFILFFGAIFFGAYAQYWNTTGNANTNPPTNYIGTTDCQPLVFKTGGHERMRLNKNGFGLGIGTPDPQSIVHIHNPGRVIECGVNSLGILAGFDKFLQLTGFYSGNNGFIASFDYSNDFYLTQTENANFTIEGPGGGLTIAPDGNVGVGTDAPQAKLDVNGSFSAQSANITGTLTANILNVQTLSFNNITTNALQAQTAKITGISNLCGNVGIGISTPPIAQMQIGNLFTFNTGSGNAIGYNNYYNGTKYARIQNGVASGILFNTDGDVIITTATSSSAGSTFYYDTPLPGIIVKNDKRVGILTTSPSADLHVAGSFRAKSARIENLLSAYEICVSYDGSLCWPDYVFTKDYNLLPLKELEQFISENQHLPNVPSAAEVEANGVKVGKMSTLLLQKIEELTLYIINLEKRLSDIEDKKDK